MMNWKRGLLRLWIFATVIWIAGIGALAVIDWREYLHRAPHIVDPFQPRQSNMAGTPVLPDDLRSSGSTTVPPPPYLLYVVLALGLPACVLAIGTGGYWVAKGFSGERG
jgi:hypothetical protein